MSNTHLGEWRIWTIEMCEGKGERERNREGVVERAINSPKTRGKGTADTNPRTRLLRVLLFASLEGFEVGPFLTNTSTNMILAHTQKSDCCACLVEVEQGQPSGEGGSNHSCA